MLNSNLDDANMGSAGIVGFLAAKISWSFGWDVMHDPMDLSIDDASVAAQPLMPLAPRPRHLHHP